MICLLYSHNVSKYFSVRIRRKTHFRIVFRQRTKCTLFEIVAVHVLPDVKTLFTISNVKLIIFTTIFEPRILCGRTIWGPYGPRMGPILVVV